MAHFYGKISGPQATAATRTGTKASGLTMHAASWDGAVRVELYHSQAGRDCARISLVPWSTSAENTSGARRVLYDGPVDAEALTQTQALALALLDAARQVESNDHA